MTFRTVRKSSTSHCCQLLGTGESRARVSMLPAHTQKSSCESLPPLIVSDIVRFSNLIFHFFGNIPPCWYSLTNYSKIKAGSLVGTVFSRVLPGEYIQAGQQGAGIRMGNLVPPPGIEVRPPCLWGIQAHLPPSTQWNVPFRRVLLNRSVPSLLYVAHAVELGHLQLPRLCPRPQSPWDPVLEPLRER